MASLRVISSFRQSEFVFYHRQINTRLKMSAQAVTTRKCANCPARKRLITFRGSGIGVPKRCFKALEAGGSVATSDRMQANPFSP
jgi:hypothetical protein